MTAALTARCAGACYPKEPEAALAYFQGFFGGEEGAKWEPAAEPDRSMPVGVVAPHIDFRVGPLAYGHAFAEWARRPAADLYLILGVGHRARREWSVDGRAYETPLGRVPVLDGAVEEIAARCPFPVADAAAHVGEHSIEFPVVLLQALRKLRGIERPFSFIPVLCGGLFDEVVAGRPPLPGSSTALFAEALRPLLDRHAGKIQLVVSIDGCHIGPRFDHPFPVDKKTLRETAAWEETLWRQVEARNLDGLFAHLGQEQNARYFDGVGALTLALHLLGDRFRLRRTAYQQWFEKGDSSVVTFTSGVLE